MANIFKEQKAVNEHPKRNNFDLSKKSNVSLKFGTLYPVYCQPVIPGDSFSIETAFNLKLMPVVFPVQTKMRAHMHFFYVRNKNLWSNWENWISNLVGQSEHPHPYISLPDSEFKNGSIHDFLGVPTSVVTNQPIYSYFEIPVVEGEFKHFYVSNSNFSSAIASGTPFTSTPLSDVVSGDYVVFTPDASNDVSDFYFGSNFDKLIIRIPQKCLQKYSPLLGSSTPITIIFEGGTRTFPSKQYSPYFTKMVTMSDYTLVSLGGVNYHQYEVAISAEDFATMTGGTFSYRHITFAYPTTAVFTPQSIPDASYLIGYNRTLNSVYDYSTLNLPLYSSNLHINALPYRAYESIYYCYYNNNVLHPLIINGQVQYNRYNTNLDDGADSTNYHLFQRNYELDFLTSALPSPQQGVAPLVGMTALGDITIEDENGITTAHADIDNDGTITKVVLTSPAASNEHARVAMNMASCGMSINDFRQTNALQRMLETNIRKGYRYMDFIAGHFGKEPEYRELDLPEFIGGFSRDVSVSTVVSNADTLSEGSPFGAALGEYGGYAQVIGGSNHAVRHYCDDFGYIIGILSVVPTPCYSQLLPKHMIAPDNFLDYPFPEFMQSGLMPITYKEVAPIQSYIDSLVDSDIRLEDTFGYQRPNYDLVSAVDEIHGDFRGSLKDYVINRIFDTRPQLGQDFISINPSEINDIFVNRNSDDDTIIGEIGFSVHAKRPVPRVVIPNLGR